MHNSPLNRPFQARLLQLSLFTASTLLKLNAYKQFRTLLPAQSRKLPKHHHITPVLKSLHWLKIPQRIHYKIVSLTCTYNTLQTSQPSYIRQLVTNQPPVIIISSLSHPLRGFATAPLRTLHQLVGTDSQKTSVSLHILLTRLLISPIRPSIFDVHKK